MQPFSVLYISAPRPFGAGVRLWWAYEGRVRDIVAPDLATARGVIADALAGLRGIPEAAEAPEPTERRVA